MSPMAKSPRKLLDVIQRAMKSRSGWRDAIGELATWWNRNLLSRTLYAMFVMWIVGATLMYLVEPADSPLFGNWFESLWNVWLALFNNVNEAPQTPAGRIVTVLLLLSGTVLASLFTASVASILVERSLRRREVSDFEMEDHLVVCNWAPRGLEWVRQVHSSIVQDKRPVVIIHDSPDDIELPDQADEPAFQNVFIVKGDPINEVILKRSRVQSAHSVVVFTDERQGEHADGKTILVCIALRNILRGDNQPNIIAECQNPRFRQHLRKAGADEVISSTELGLRLIARAALFHGMTRVYQELLTVRRDANEMYMVEAPPALIGQDFVTVAERFLRQRTGAKSCLLIGVQRGETMMLNPVGDEAGPLREGDMLIVLSQVFPDLTESANTVEQPA